VCGTTFMVNCSREDTDSSEASRPRAPQYTKELPARIYCVIVDILPLAKISAAARKLDVKVEFIKRGQDLMAALAELPEEAWPSLIVVDLNNVYARPFTLIPQLRSKLNRFTSIIGLVSRVQGELKHRGLKAGCDTVVTLPAFWKGLRKLLRRYGRTEEVRVYLHASA